jgi:hypothetical protein
MPTSGFFTFFFISFVCVSVFLPYCFKENAIRKSSYKQVADFDFKTLSFYCFFNKNNPNFDFQLF